MDFMVIVVAVACGIALFVGASRILPYVIMYGIGHVCGVGLWQLLGGPPIQAPGVFFGIALAWFYGYTNRPKPTVVVVHGQAVVRR
jgi:hypothetical protein